MIYQKKFMNTVESKKNKNCQRRGKFLSAKERKIKEENQLWISNNVYSFLQLKREWFPVNTWKCSNTGRLNKMPGMSHCYYIVNIQWRFVLAKNKENTISIPNKTLLPVCNNHIQFKYNVNLTLKEYWSLRNCFENIRVTFLFSRRIPQGDFMMGK